MMDCGGRFAKPCAAPSAVRTVPLATTLANGGGTNLFKHDLSVRAFFSGGAKRQRQALRGCPVRSLPALRSKIEHLLIHGNLDLRKHVPRVRQIKIFILGE